MQIGLHGGRERLGLQVCAHHLEPQGTRMGKAGLVKRRWPGAGRVFAHTGQHTTPYLFLSAGPPQLGSILASHLASALAFTSSNSHTTDLQGGIPSGHTSQDPRPVKTCAEGVPGERQEGAEEVPQSPDPPAVSSLPRDTPVPLRFSGIFLQVVK